MQCLQILIILAKTAKQFEVIGSPTNMGLRGCCNIKRFLSENIISLPAISMPCSTNFFRKAHTHTHMHKAQYSTLNCPPSPPKSVLLSFSSDNIKKQSHAFERLKMNSYVSPQLLS